jgi:hypothetical protein
MRHSQAPEDAFTPNAVAPQLLERRNKPDIPRSPDLQDSSSRVSDKGAQLRVSGDTRVDKTPLVTFAATEAGLKRLVIERIGTPRW